MAATDIKTKALVDNLQILTEQLMGALEQFEILRDQKNATGVDFNTEGMNAIYAAAKGLEHVDGNVVNAVFTQFEGLIAYLDTVGQFRRDPLNKFRTGAATQTFRGLRV
jgi:hypothetical protein